MENSDCAASSNLEMASSTTSSEDVPAGIEPEKEKEKVVLTVMAPAAAQDTTAALEVPFSDVEVAKMVPEAAAADAATLKKFGQLVEDVGPCKDLSAWPFAVLAPFRHVVNVQPPPVLRPPPPIPVVIPPRVSTF